MFRFRKMPAIETLPSEPTPLSNTQFRNLLSRTITTLEADHPISLGLGYGKVRARDAYSSKDTIVGVTKYRPGQHTRIHPLDTFATGRLMGLQYSGRSNANNVHIFVDLSDRLRNTIGPISLHHASMAIYGLVKHIAEKSGAHVSTYAIKQGYFTTDTTPVYGIDRSMHNLERLDKKVATVFHKDKSGLALAFDKYKSTFHDPDDTIIIVSDFRDGFRDGNFDWEKSLPSARDYRDRLNIFHLDNPALHGIIPFTLDGYDQFEIEAYNQQFRDLDEEISRRIELLLSSRNAETISNIHEYTDPTSCLRSIGNTAISFLSKA